jgi:DNA-binding transcriptional MerR regulator
MTTINDKMLPLQKNPPANRDSALKLQLVERRYPMKTVILKDRKIRLYSISWLARLAGKSPRTFHTWEAAGVFPKPIFALPDGYRWYCAAEVAAYSKLAKKAMMRKGQGRPRKGVKPQSQWLRENSFEVQRQIKRHYAEHFDIFPDKLKDEDAILQSIQKASHITLSQETINRIIHGS